VQRLSLLLAAFVPVWAATLDSAPGATASPPISVSCQGITFIAGYRPSYGGTPLPPATVTTEFVGADPACASRASSPLPGYRNEYTGPGPANRLEGFPRFASNTLLNVWPGIDVTSEVIGRHVRITFDVSDPTKLPTLRTPQGEFLNDNDFSVRFLIDDIRFFAQDTRATLRAEELTPQGPQTVALEVNPLRLRELASNPIRITLEATFPDRTDAPTASLLDRASNLFEVVGPVIRKYGPDGILLFETELTGGQFAELVYGPEESIYAIGSTLSADYFTTPGAAQNTFTGVYVYRTPRAAIPFGDLAITRLDAVTGRVIFSTLLGGPYQEFARTLGVDSSGRLQLLVTSNSPTFPRAGGAIGTSCQPQAPVITSLIGFSNGGFACRYLVQIAASSGAINFSKPLPANTVDAAIGADGAIYVLRTTSQPDPRQPATLAAIDAYSSTGTVLPLLAFPLPKNVVWYSGTIAVDAAGGVWLSTLSIGPSQYLFHRPSGASAPRRIEDVDFNGTILPQPGGGILLTGAALGTGRHYDENVLMPTRCPDSFAQFAVIDAVGTVQYASYLPDTLEIPAREAPPVLRGRILQWGRHRLDFDAPPHPANICGSALSISPGALVQIPVRGVPDASPFRPAKQPGDQLPFHVRGFAIKVNGRPAGIVELNQEFLTVAIPFSVTPPLQFTAWNGDRQIPFSNHAVWFFDQRYEVPSISVLGGATSLRVLQKPVRTGNELRLLVTGVGPVTPPLADNEIPANSNATPSLPFLARTEFDTPVPIVYFRQVPDAPPGVFDLRLRLPETWKPTQWITLYTTTEALGIFAD
jgi:uncharacterized protein (TIGR03437 family)